MRILLVDENPHSLSGLAAFLGENLSGVEIVSASGVVDAAEYIADTVPDFLVTSVFFEDASEGDGFSLRDAVLERSASAAIAFISAQALGEYESYLLPEDKLLYSPIEGEDLLEWILEKVGMVTPPPGGEPEIEESIVSEGEGLPASGTQLGDYQLLELTSVEDRVAVYRALQLRVQREVALVLLNPALAGTKEGIRAFREHVRAKAVVNHPRITPVYEAHEEGDIVFYTRERAKGQSLAQLASAGVKIKQETLLRVTRETAEAYLTLGKNGGALAPLHCEKLYLDDDGELEIVNPAEEAPNPAQSQASDIASLGHALLSLSDTTSLAHAHIYQVANRMVAAFTAENEPVGETALTTWHSVIEAASEAQDALSEARSLHAPEDTAAVVQNTAAQKFAEKQRAKKVSKAIATFAVVLLIGGALFWFARGGGFASAPVPLEEMAAFERVSGGSFIYQDGKELDLPTFWIGRYEVTIALYRDFLKASALTPEAFDHPDQPPSKTSHAPTINLDNVAQDTPITGIDWWDAYAYATYKGARLPSEEEWEKAARGTNGDPYPWGTDPAPGNANLGNTATYPVTSFPTDSSYYSSCGMAGNVSEWTATKIPHPTIPDLQTAVVRGGSYSTPPTDRILSARMAAESLEERVPTIGFRIVRDTPPE